MAFLYLCHWTLLCLSWLLALGWVWRAAVSVRNLPRVPDLLAVPYSLPCDPVQNLLPALDSPPALCVIVPARDEAAAIAATLESLLATKGLAIEIIAIDDRSSDTTGEIMDGIAALHTGRIADSTNHRMGHVQLTVLHIEQLPAGWLGKTHAMAMAAQRTSAPWLLFTDADVVYRPDTLARAIRFLEGEQADHLVLVPTLILRSFGERMMIAFLRVISVWAARPWRVADPRARHDFIGIGAFNLVRRDVYEAIGGFRSLRMEVLEDVRLGFKVKRAGYKQRVAFGRDLIRIRWADGAMGVVGNLTKNAFSAFRFRLILILAACAGLALQATLPFAGLFFNWPVRSASLVSLAMIIMMYRYFEQHSDSGIRYAATFPFAGLLFVYAMLRSVVLTVTEGGVRWRGTFYPLRELRKHCGPLW